MGSSRTSEFFEPASPGTGNNEFVRILPEELESIRLVDLEGNNQETAASRMGVSRRTLWRDLHEGRQKVADALVNRKLIIISDENINKDNYPGRGRCRRRSDECPYYDEEINSGSDEKMKLAVAKQGDVVSEHFGQCEGFMLFVIEDGEIKSEEFVESPEHRPGVIPEFLASVGVTDVIAGGMGGGAVNIFNSKGINVFTGIAGPIRAVAEEFAKGNIESSGSICSHTHH